MPRRPWLFVVAWTILCSIPVARVLGRLTDYSNYECRDMCGLAEGLGALMIATIFLVWLAVTVLAFFVAGRLRR